MLTEYKHNSYGVRDMIYDTTPKKLGLTSSQKLILIGLIRYMNEDGNCFPSLSLIAEKTGLNRRTVIRAIDVFKTKGYITVGKKYNDYSDRVHNFYTINISLLEDIKKKDNVVSLVQAS